MKKSESKQSAIRTPHSALIGFIQAGGRSSRMGTDKAWLEIAGQPMIERVLAATHPVVQALAIVINADNPNFVRYQDLARKWKARLITDLHDHRGPLGGIDTALKNCGQNESALIIACDLPFITTEFLSLLREIHEDENLQSVTLSVDQDGRLQPLAGIYSASCSQAVEQMLAEDLLRVDLICSRVQTRIIPFKEYGHLPNAEKILTNINSKADYQAMKK